MKIAVEVPQAIVIQNACKIEGELVLETVCRNYDHYKVLPEVILYEGIVCGKTGWNSDRQYACYKSNVPIAKAVSVIEERNRAAEIVYGAAFMYPYVSFVF